MTAITTYKDVRMKVSWETRLKLSLFLYAVVFTQLSLLVYFGILFPLVIGFILAAAATFGLFIFLVWINLSITRIIKESKIKRGWSEKTVTVLHKINNWATLAVIIFIAFGVIIGYEINRH